MTPAEWLSCDDAEPMLDFLRGKVSERKLRLYILACCQKLWGNSSDEATQVAFQSLECLVETLLETRKAFIRVRPGRRSSTVERVIRSGRSC
jgi:hypothetical protein